MAGRLILSGGGDEKQTYTVDEVFLKGANRILYIPIAWPNEDFESCLKWFKNAMLQHKKVEIKMLINLNEKINLKEYDAIYIGGGNTFKLLKKIKESGFDKKLIEFYKTGGTIFGGSAGAIIWGNDINTATLGKIVDKNKVGLKDTGGLNMIKECDLHCHFEGDELNEHINYIKKTKRNIIAVPEESALLVENNKFKVIGLKPITFISEKEVKKFIKGVIF